jgi:hypothetical protein
MTDRSESPFLDLPAALVEEMLARAGSVGDELLRTFQSVKSDRAEYRHSLEAGQLILRESSLGYPPIPTSCAADGSYAIERLLTADLAAAAAVVVEGLTPPSEQRFWDQPHHSIFVAAEVHSESTSTILRAIMLGRELLLAANAPHELVMIDGTLTLPIIYFNQAINAAPETAELQCSAEFIGNCVSYLESYCVILRSQRSDRNFVGIPKYSTRREIGHMLAWPGNHDDRGFLTLLLHAGELTRPVGLEQPSQPWHLNSGRLPADVRSRIEPMANEISSQLGQTCVLYYKPHDWLPALRIEAASSVAKNQHRLASVIQGIKHQAATAAMLEPYPLFLADRTVKALARSIPAFRQVTTQRISETYDGDIGEVFFAMHGYRSESGA